MTCRDEILACVHQMTAGSFTAEFSIDDVVACMRRSGSRYRESTIRTHVASKLCVNAPDHHDTTYDDFVRVRHGVYHIHKK